jgi:AcrR family transcriptional regulator
MGLPTGIARQVTDATAAAHSSISTMSPDRHTPAPRAPAGCANVRADDPRIERTWAAVIEAAAELMMTDGPSAVTHANVAAAANVSRTTAYKHWPTRADLLRSTIEELGRARVADEDLTGDLRTDLRLVVADIIDDLADDQRAPLVAAMIQQSLHDPTVAAVRDDMLAEFAPVVRTVLEAGIGAGELRADLDTELAMATILGSFLYMRFMTPEPFDTATADRILAEFVAANAARRP